MKFNKFLKFTLGAVFALPVTIFFGNEISATNFSESYEFQSSEETMLACGGGGGGGGGGGSPADKKKAAAKKAKVKLNFKKRKLAEKSAAGEDTTKLQSEIAALEAVIADAK